MHVIVIYYGLFVIWVYVYGQSANLVNGFNRRKQNNKDEERRDGIK